MRPDVLFLDCYGTLVEGDRPVIEAVVHDAAERAGVDPEAVDRPWWDEFSALCAEAVGPRFEKQYELEVQSLSSVLERLGSPLPRRVVEQVMAPLVDYWRGASPYPDAVELLETWTACPIVIVSNIDRADIVEAVRRLPPVAAVITSEDARAYKPHVAVFELALAMTGVSADRVVHVGDSWSSDVLGATAEGIRAVHIDRTARQTLPERLTSVRERRTPVPEPVERHATRGPEPVEGRPLPVPELVDGHPTPNSEPVVGRPLPVPELLEGQVGSQVARVTSLLDLVGLLSV